MKRILITLLMAVFFVLTGTEIPRIEPVVFALQGGRMTGKPGVSAHGSLKMERGAAPDMGGKPFLPGCTPVARRSRWRLI